MSYIDLNIVQMEEQVILSESLLKVIFTFGLSPSDPANVEA